ncbi:DEAD/DEAH box helicase [Aromatoleum toluvorans]|uniref:DEAD/DEAH box helicase n=1 Tax=Aromatoleum toluvorans TaxID=92002 RepID=A0ABX1PS75_9RHOO|nr:helicase-related protein [Aromatoleum toluvorans]NMG42289.1 DEAD/DEAH box helicase [Aromatoleum toluvorans]
MNTPIPEFYPGSLVSARGREWIVLPESDQDTLRLRPLGGGEKDESLIYLPLERQPVRPATFPWPRVGQARNHAASQLLLDALQLKLRNGAGPFRSFGNIAVEPRAYQLVPMLMALKQATVRLLIADDVGVGKTIEAALIAREMLDRGEVQRMTVLCPPHLCEQWQRELAERFHIHAMVVRTATAARLEKDLPPGTSVFDAHPFTVVSLDYIKSERRREAFQRFCPEFVIVDEAHTCTQGGQGRQQRYQLLKGLAENEERHLVLLTATPHSGDESAFYNLLGLLRSEFPALKDLPPGARTDLRDELSRHFVQRRRPDIAEWQDTSMFPDRKTTEVTYRLTGAWGQLFNDVLVYARELVERAEGKALREQRMNWWAALALLRCISSSPAAAVNALRTRLNGAVGAEDGRELTLEDIDQQGEERVLDGLDDALSTDDIEPAAQTEDTARLRELIAAAERLAGPGNDPKLEKLQAHLQSLLKEGFLPVVFCRYIATAHYLADFLRTKFKDVTIKAVTGEFTPGEREAAVEELGDSDKRILVATDCLSEGINLQSLFTAVVHYDLSWNPTRHEQRDGRVDRFGQKAREVRSTMLYGEDNPVDGAVLQVILRKAESIRKELGVLVPMPDDEGKLTQALLNAVLLRKGNALNAQSQLELFGAPAKEIETAWQSAREKAARNRSIFAQRRLKPEDVLPEWRKSAAVLGGEDDVARFVTRAVAKLGVSLEDYRGHHKLNLDQLPLAVRERLAADSFIGTLRVSFYQPPAPGSLFIHRTHPIVAALADTLLERALEEAADASDADAVARAGAAFVGNVSLRTTVLLLRLRHQLSVTRGTATRLMLCEETVAVTVAGSGSPEVLAPDAARLLLGTEAVRNMPPPIRDRHLQQALDQLPAWTAQLEAMAKERAQALLQDHRRVREAAEAKGSYQVTASLPVDVVGVYVLIPAVGV